MSPQPEKLLVNIKEAAEMLNIGKSLFYSMLSSGKIGPRPVRFGSKQLFSVDELRRWVDAGCPVREKWLTGKR